MKFLDIKGFFKLPDTFKGGIADSLRLLADYHEKEETAEIRETPHEEQNFFEYILKRNDKRNELSYFFKTTTEGKRFSGGAGIYLKEKNEYNLIKDMAFDK